MSITRAQAEKLLGGSFMEEAYDGAKVHTIHLRPREAWIKSLKPSDERWINAETIIEVDLEGKLGTRVMPDTQQAIKQAIQKLTGSDKITDADVNIQYSPRGIEFEGRIM